MKIEVPAKYAENYHRMYIDDPVTTNDRYMRIQIAYAHAAKELERIVHSERDQTAEELQDAITSAWQALHAVHIDMQKVEIQLRRAADAPDGE